MERRKKASKDKENKNDSKDNKKDEEGIENNIKSFNSDLINSCSPDKILNSFEKSLF